MYVTVSLWIMVVTVVMVVVTLIAMAVSGPNRRTIYGLYVIVAVLILNIVWGVIQMTRPSFVTEFLTKIFK